ncbi:hypothetical protein [Sinorhizobium americanum]|uniref:Uncharacterized protein n=1 Tax=Sinorhizobium americanum TaxID=194963 RepID=A0A4R2BRF0_9HYPH|nr:hypothetical protein [Sinorhizobium americanum]TCN30297.1 hypothetical protein EV184_108171 [Sinorhizobium americanum]
MTAKPFCDMSIDELDAELRQLNAQIRRAPAWSAHLSAMNEFRRDCEQWLRRRRDEAQEKARG